VAALCLSHTESLEARRLFLGAPAVAKGGVLKMEGMLARKPQSLEAYLLEEERSPVKREFYRGFAYATAGASALHNRVALTAEEAFRL
jgi:hypothetical protein